MTYALTYYASQVDARAGYLLAPYCAWLTFAAYLNGEGSRSWRASRSETDSLPIYRRLLVVELWPRKGLGAGQALGQEGPQGSLRCLKRIVAVVERYELCAVAYDGGEDTL